MVREQSGVIISRVNFWISISLFVAILSGLFLLITPKISAQQAGKKQEIYNPALTRQEKLENWDRFNKQFQNKWKVKWNPVTGTPHRISGYFIQVPERVTKENVGRVASGLLRRYKDILQIDPDRLVLSKVDYNEPQNAESGVGTSYVFFRQKQNDLFVHGGVVRLVIRQQKLTLLGSDYYPGIEISTTPEISGRQLVGILARELRQKKDFKPLETELLVYPEAIEGGVLYRLAWKATMPVMYMPADIVEPVDRVNQDEKRELKDMPVQWQYFIDARSGDIIKRINVFEYEDLNGTVTGMVRPAVPADAPESRPISYMNITLTQGGSTFTGVTDLLGNYTVTGLSPGAATLEAQLIGPHVVIHNNDTGTVATHSDTLTIPTAGNYDWNWDLDDTSPDDVETNVFYHVNWIHDWYLRGDPFNILPDPYPMDVYVRDRNSDGELYCNAGASSTGLYFSGLPGSCSDFGLCADIIYHEFTHRVVHKVYDGAGVPYPATPQGGAMNEAWSDYFPGSIFNTPEHGTGCYGGRNFDVPDKRYPDDWIGEVHADGIIFSGAIWDVRTVLGNIYVDNLALRGMKNAESNFSDYLGAVLEEDDDPAYSPDPSANSNPADGTPNIDTICHSYYDIHGIYHDYCAGHTENPVALIQLPDLMSYNLLTDTATPISIVGTALGSSTNALQNFTLEYAPESAPGSWSSAGITLAGGGTTPVVSGFLGQWNIAGVSDGFYLIRLVVTDTGSNTAVAETGVVIDSGLMSGWPQASGAHFYSTPAVADLDPSFAGNEIVACGTDYKVYAWHSDGTNAPGWPVSSGSVYSSPAVADLDGDGTLEVVVSEYSGSIKVYEQDGTSAAGWPQVCGGNVRATPALGDLDGDGDLEIVVGSSDANVYAWHHDGTAVAGWPITVTAEVFSSAAIGDVDNDGLLEVVASTDDGNAYIWKGDGTLLPGWPIATGDELSASAALGDLDGDGDLEIVIGSRDLETDYTLIEQKVYAWHHDGTAVTGWPNAITERLTRPASASLADLDGDGDLEVIVMSNDDRIHVWEADGTPVSGWPPAVPGFSGWEIVVSSPSIGDIDGDGDMEIVVEATYDEIPGHELFRLFKVYALHHDGSIVAGWPKIVSKYSNSSPVIADVDLDGDVEVLVGSDGLFIWDLAGAYSTHNMEWPHYRHDLWRTGLYGPKDGVVLLFDTSGSMSWSHDGTMGVPPALQRLTFAKQAAYPFLEMLNTYNANKANFGIAVFPPHPWSYSVGCNGQVVTPMTKINTATKTTAVTTTIPGLVAEGNTPLLAGLEKAASMFGSELNRVILLLSDGYHNCPYYSGVGVPEVVDLISRLNADSIRVFTIGFGRPSDVDHPFLEEFANGTTPSGYSGSQFYDVTTAAFVPATWDPALALDGVYKAILSDALDLETAVDPMGIITAGTSKDYEVKLSEHDTRVSVFLSWVTQQNNRLDLKVYSSDGVEVVAGPGGEVSFAQGNTYKILTINRQFLQRPGKVGPTPWKIVIGSPALSPGEQERFQYSVILNSALKMKTGLDKNEYATGDSVKITARITEAGAPLTGLSDVNVQISRPGDGIGNWFALNKVSPEDLARVPAQKGSENLSMLLRKAIFLADIQKIPIPVQLGPTTMKLYDDGTHGDMQADDGVYTNVFTGTDKEGTYSFYFSSSGPTAGGNSFERDDIIQEYVKVGVIPNDEMVQAAALTLNADIQQYKVMITPKDAKGNFLGPRYSNKISLSTSAGKFVGELEDDLAGTYSQVLQIPANVDIKQVKINIKIFEKERTYYLSKLIAKRLYSVSVHTGVAIPIGSSGDRFDWGTNLLLDVDYHFTPQLSAVGFFGYNSFKSKVAWVDDTYWLNFSANLKYRNNIGRYSPYIAGGFGYYIPENGDSGLGRNIGFGLDYDYSSKITLEVGGDYHKVFDKEIQFWHTHAGIIFRF